MSGTVDKLKQYVDEHKLLSAVVLVLVIVLVLYYAGVVKYPMSGASAGAENLVAEVVDKAKKNAIKLKGMILQ